MYDSSGKVMEKPTGSAETGQELEPAMGFPNDPVMRGTPLAVDPTVMQALFSAELLRKSGAAYRIDACRLRRIRYRPAEHCFLHYELDLFSSKSGRCEKVWLTGVIYPDERPRRRLKKLLAACEGKPASEGWHAFGPAFYLPAPHMLVQTFPCDRRLPSLPVIFADKAVELDAQFTGMFQPGEWQITGRKIQPARYRALSGAVLKYSIEATEARSGEQRSQTCYVKIGRIGEGAREARLLETLRKQAAGEAFNFAKPLAYLEGSSALMVEEAPGVSFEQAILRGKSIEESARQTARGLAAFHLWSVEAPSASEAVISRLNVANQYLAWACPALADDMRSIAHTVTAALARTPLGPAHLDLKPDHIFLDGERVLFIDLDTFGAADPVLDIATLLARLEAMPMRFGAKTESVETAARALAEEYFSLVPAEWQGRLALNRAIADLQVASEFFRHQHPDWRELVPAWISRARQATDPATESATGSSGKDRS